MKDEIFSLIKSQLEELNEELEYESLNKIDETTPIFGGEDSIDSLSLVRFVTEVESKIEELYDLNIVLADEKAMSMKYSPYRNVKVFRDFVMTRVKNNDK